MSDCLQCEKTNLRKGYRYCSNKCQMDYQYEQYIVRWKAGLVDGSRGVSAKNISGHLTRYLRVKYGEACSLCGWNQVNLYTGRVPLEIDHIDGDAENNVESNLRVICPNCHALTASFRNLNKGKGRSWRTLKYIKVQK
ncbi:MAG: hypothetical protein JWL89_299 [Candidatus Saccharibacteria bacterium]|nr:hypothetical protein [Candidatus Saccharibacteria bacterium]